MPRRRRHPPASRRRPPGGGAGRCAASRRGFRVRPGHAVEQPRTARRPALADQPEAAVLGRPEQHIRPTEKIERPPDDGGVDAGNVGAEKQARARREPVEAARHALAEIALALVDAGQPGEARQPAPQMPGRPARRNRDDQLPFRAPGQPRADPLRGLAIEAPGGGRADIRRQPRLDRADERRLQEQDRDRAAARRYRPACQYSRASQAGGAPMR